jgi:hypothetical protein
MNSILLRIHVLWFLKSGQLQAELCNLYPRTSQLQRSSRSVCHSDQFGAGLVYFVSSGIGSNEMEKYGARTLTYVIILKMKLF